MAFMEATGWTIVYLREMATPVRFSTNYYSSSVPLRLLPPVLPFPFPLSLSVLEQSA